ncbi:MAG TPA: YfhO family protein, partial [Acidimicrobiales bacterium]|nr:YfhO family protein [Acidimicrobiales bacterium]
VRDVTTRLVGIGLGAAAGAALSAPLLLPGAAVLRQSIRSLGGGASGGRNAIAVMDLTHSTVAGVNGPWYLGVISIVLAVVAVAFRWRSIETVALVVLAAVMAGLAFAQPIISVLASTPGLEAVRWPRAVILVALPLSVLAGLGVQDVTGARDLADVRRWLGWGFGAAGAVVVVLLLTGSSKVSTSTEGTLGLAWPAIGVAAGLSTVAYLALPDRGRTGDPVPGLLRRRRVRAAVALVAVQSVFLVAAGAPLWPSSPDYFAPTSGELALHRAVGDALVGLGSSDCYLPPALGIRPNANLFVGVQQLAVYDPMLPSAYYRSWRTITGQSPDSAGFPAVSTYCPPITSVAIARAYGVGYVLEPRGTTGPAGTVLAARVADEDVYRVPGAATVTATPTDDPNGATTALPVGRPGPASMSFTTHGSTPLRLVIRVTSTPGWHATIDGRALALAPYEGVMLQASVPAGTHVVAMHYAPTTFTAGVALATVVLVAAAVWLVVGEHLLPRRRRASPDGPGSDGPAAATAPPPP